MNKIRQISPRIELAMCKLEGLIHLGKSECAELKCVLTELALNCWEDGEISSSANPNDVDIMETPKTPLDPVGRQRPFSKR